MNKIIYRLVLFAERHAALVIVATVLATAVFGWFALRIQADTDVNSLVPENPEVRRLTEKYGTANVSADYLLVIFGDPELFTAHKLGVVAGVCERISAIEHLRSGITPFNFIRFENRGGRLALGTMGPGGQAPSTDEDAAALRARLLDDPLARNLIISADGTWLCAVWSVESTDYREMILGAAQAVIDPARSEIDNLTISGTLPIHQAILDSLYKDLPTFLLLALGVLLVSYFLSFGSLRSVILPMLVVIIGTTWTFGTMAILGFRITVVSVIAPPLVLILGSSYSLHTLNQYYREVEVAGVARRWIADSVQNVSVTIFLASTTTMIGFVSLLFCSLKQVRQLGVTTAIGIAYCALLALFFLPSVLSLLKPPTTRQRDRVVDGGIAHFMARLARIVIHRRWVVVGVSLAVVALFAVAIGRVRYDTNFLGYFRRHEPAVEASRLLIDKFTGFEYLYLTLTVPEDQPGYFQDPAVLKSIARYEDALRQDPDVKYLASFTGYLRAMNKAMSGSSEVPETRPLVLVLSRYLTALSDAPVGKSLLGTMLNRDATQYTIQLHVWDHKAKTLAFEVSLGTTLPRLQAMAKEMLPAGVTAEYWGETVTVLRGARVMTRDQITSIFSSAFLVFVLSAVVFRSLRQGIAVLAPMTVGIMLNFIVMGIFSIPLDAVTITFASIAIGIGVDNALHLTIWYRRQLGVWPQEPERCVEETLRIAGRPMLLTTLSIMGALLVFIFSRFRPVAYFGVLISLSLLMTTAAALLLLTALLYFGARRRAARSVRR